MGLSFGTQETADYFLKLQEDGDPKFKEAIAGLDLSLLMVSLDCPGNVDRQLAITFEGGRFIQAIATEKPAPSDLRTAPFDHTKYNFRLQAPQQTYLDMISGKMDMLQALPAVKIEGDFAKLMAKAQGFMRFIEFLGTLDLEP